jgi:leucyl aminopeptidase
MQLQRQECIHQTDSDTCIIIGAFADHTLTPLGETLDGQSNGYLKRLLKRNDLKSSYGESIFISEMPNLTSRVLLVFCGEKNKLDDHSFRKLLKKTAIALQALIIKQVYCELTELPVSQRDLDWKTLQIATYLIAAYYRFNQYKTDNNLKPVPANFILQTNAEAFVRAQALLDGLQLVKDLGNTPGNICTPSYLAEQAAAIAKKYPKINVEVLEEKQMGELGMGSLLSVSKGSHQPAKFICLHYAGGAKTQKPYVFIGKGITFDTGGISLKLPPAMDEMKYDMCGGATVLALIQTAAQLELPLNIIGLVPAAENMPDGQATRPGDIVKSMSGKTIEILNTDAEGRLILCDALTYAERFNPECVIDLATLTGSVLLTFGNVTTAVMGNSANLIQSLVKAAQESGERTWELPLWEEYQEMLTSNFADLPNIHNDNYAKAIIAGCFLSRFTEKYPWAHLDIAGTAMLSGKDKGATGRPLPMLLQFLLDKVAAH